MRFGLSKREGKARALAYKRKKITTKQLLTRIVVTGGGTTQSCRARGELNHFLWFSPRVEMRTPPARASTPDACALTMARIGDPFVVEADERPTHAEPEPEPEPATCDDEPDRCPRFFVYWIVTEETRRSYIGATVDLRRRIRQHNGELVGGARRTRRGRWRYHRIVGGFRTWREALQFEWAFKHVSRRARSIATRQKALEVLLRRERWTRNAPLARDVPLRVHTSVDEAIYI